MVMGPEGVCSGVLVAPNLVATARHCAAQFAKGLLDCTPAGELAPDSPGGSMGADNAPSSMSIMLASSVPTASAQSTPDAVGKQILSTQSPSGCRDDLALIVLDRSLPVTPVPVRLDRPTSVGEDVSVWGYGQTANAEDLPALRVYEGAQIVGIGPSVATTTPELAPVRSVRVGTGAITCDGDSGGPILSSDTGALIAVISVGPHPSGAAGCDATGDSPTTGPRMAEYRNLVLQAFAAAGADPNLEPPLQDAEVEAQAGEPIVESGIEPEESGVEPPSTLTSDEGGCAVSPGHRGLARGVAPLLSIALLGGSGWRRRRLSKPRNRLLPTP
jgi:hypothetical protein